MARLLRGRRGVTALEYGLIAAVVGGVVVSGSMGFGSSLTSAYGALGGALTNVAGVMGAGGSGAAVAATAPAPAGGSGAGGRD